MVGEILVVSGLFLLLCIGLVIRLIYQNNRIDNDAKTLQTLSLEMAQYQQKVAYQNETIEELKFRIVRIEEQNKALMQQHHDDKV
ncbi:MAG: hypothetical protein JXQ76_10480, partial [Campylobacterales bacterium]|nr:hypothetical protein [Campylobacterales bacterium]